MSNTWKPTSKNLTNHKFVKVFPGEIAAEIWGLAGQAQEIVGMVTAYQAPREARQTLHA